MSVAPSVGNGRDFRTSCESGSRNATEKIEQWDLQVARRRVIFLDDMLMIFSTDVVIEGDSYRKNSNNQVFSINISSQFGRRRIIGLTRL